MTNSTVTAIPASVTWTGKKSRLKVKFPKITDADLRFLGDSKNEMISNLASKLGKTRAEMNEIIDVI